MDRIVTRRLHSSGGSTAVVLPPDYLDELDLKEGDDVFVYLTGNRIVVKAVDAEVMHREDVTV